MKNQEALDLFLAQKISFLLFLSAMESGEL